jgi:[ribosomal protein S5]-alanine N-acetyltransferase
MYAIHALTPARGEAARRSLLFWNFLRGKAIIPCRRSAGNENWALSRTPSRISGSLQGMCIMKTRRLVLAPASPGDANEYHDFLQRNRERFRLSVPAEALERKVEDWKRIFSTEQRVGEDAVRLLMRVSVAEDDGNSRIAGDIRVDGVMRGPFQAGYLGFKVDQRWEGAGLMTEALSAVISYSFRELQLHRLMANYRAENGRSAKILSRLGFVIEGNAKRYLYLDGGWRDHVLTSLLTEDWDPAAFDPS